MYLYNTAFHQVLNGSVKLAKAVIRMPCEPSAAFLNNPKAAAFANSLGAIDGSYYGVLVPDQIKERFRNRKGGISFNVCAVVTHDGLFSYMLVGWEGSAHDMRVFHSAVSRDLHIPEGRYLLADAGYEGATGLLVPYRGVRYHLQEYGVINRRPQHYTELYNLRHSQFRIIVEKTFGVHKGTFKIFRQAPKHGIITTIKLIYATAGIFNFIRGASGVPDTVSNIGEAEGPVNTSNAVDMAELRNVLALQMWDEYVQFLEERGQYPLGFNGE